MNFKNSIIGAVALLLISITDTGSVVGQEVASTPVQASALSLTATDVATFSSLSDVQMTALLDMLGSTPTVAAADLPTASAGFFSLAHPEWPPLPCDTSGSAAWSLSGGAYLLNDLDFNYDAPQKQTLAKGVTMHAMDFSGPPSFSESSGTNTPDDTVMPPVNYGTNLWIAQTMVTNRYLTGIGSNTLADVQYEIQSVTNISQSNWQSEGFILGSETTNWTPLSVAQGNRTNQLFLRLRSWADDGSGLPIWWQLQYFGTTGVDPYGDPAGDGWSNLQKFQNGWNPNTFYTPPTPPLTVSLNVTNGLATLNWLPSPGPVTNYLVIKYDYQTGLQTEFNFSPGTNRFADDLSADVPEDLASDGPELDVSYQIQAQYPNGNSALGDEQWAEWGFSSMFLVRGAQGSTYLAAPSLPPGTVGLRLTRVDHQAEAFYGDPSFDTNYFIPTTAFTNGLYLLPTSVTTPPTDAYGYALYEWWVEIVNAQGQPVNWPGLLSEGYYLGDNYAHSWMGTPYFDGRAQLKQSLAFLFRAANADAPLQFVEYGTNFSYANYVNLHTNPPAYAYAGLFRPNNDPSSDSLDILSPFTDNYRYRNFAYATTNVNTSGSITTGLHSDYVYYFSAYGLILQDVPTYQFALPTYNGQVIAPVLATNDTRWLCQYPLSLLGGDATLIGITSQQPTSGSLIWTLGSSAQNYWGLPYVSAKLAYANGSGGLATTTLSPGGSFQIANASVYLETAPPQFQTVEYDFWNRPSWPYANTVLPGQAAFSPTNASQLLIANVGQNNFQVMGYAKLAVTNSAYSGVYGYLGQYFDQAYKITNGVATTNTTGVLSSYGNFFPTEPGPAALVTMPDLDTGARGTATVYCVSLQLDANHDGNMDLSFSGTDATSPANPFVFWANNNYDRWLYDEDDATNYMDGLNSIEVGQTVSADERVPDCHYGEYYGTRSIPTTRDLEDFARLWVCGITTNLLNALPTNSTVTLNWGDVGSPNSANPTIDLFTAADADGGIGYLTNSTIAANQLNYSLYPFIQRLAPGGSIQLNANFFGNIWRGNHFIWCGVTNGSGQLNLTIADGSGNVLAQSSAYIQIKDIKQMYERWTVGDDASKTPLTVAVKAVNDLPANPPVPAFQYPAPPDTNTPYILFVHGWNMRTDDKDHFAETAFKRLYWQGYQGRFGSFRWPTGNGFTGSYWQTLSDPRNFDNSEFNAWQSAAGLRNKLKDLNAEYPGHVYTLAHSMGNIVAGEALRLAAQNGDGQLVNTYVASQAALPAHDYDSTVTTPYLLSFTYTYPSGLLSAFGSQNYGPHTPNIYGNRLTNNAAAVGRRINFYNENDFALAAPRWCFDQITKPDYIPPNNYYAYSGSLSDPAPWNHFVVAPYVGGTDVPVDIVTNLNNLYKIMAYAAQSYSTALGASPGIANFIPVDLTSTVNPIWPSPDPLDNDYKSHFWHSAQFRGDAWQEWNYWQTLLRSSTLGFNIQN